MRRDHKTSAEMAAVAAVWASFPVGLRPRPLVLVQPAIGGPGLRTTSDKIAYSEGRISFDPAVQASARHSLERVARIRVDSPGETLLVRSAERMEEPFLTDRGWRRLPAWRLELREALGPFV